MYNLFKFIEDKRPEYKVPFKIKLLYAPETLTKEDLDVKDDLDLRGSSIEFLPKNLTQVNGDLILIRCENLKSLPNNLTVNGRLDLERCKNITSLPSGLKVKGRLDLADTNITELPPDLEFGQNLILMRTPIEKLPDNLIVNGDLDLEDCKNITSLPSGLIVNDDLDLRGTNITELPPDLKVAGDLILWGTPLSKKYTTEEELKAKYPDLKVKGKIYL